MKTIFEYLDYRQFLSDFYEAKRAEGKMSLRSFSQKAGISAKCYLNQVIRGARNLTPDTIHRFARGLGLRKDEAEFFENLVLMNQATDHEEKDRYYQRLSSVERYLEIKRLERDQYAFFSKWYYAAIQEMTLLPDFQNNPAWIARRLRPRITPDQAREAVELLLRLGLLVQDGKGKLCQAAPHLRSGSEVAALSMCNFHLQMLKRGAEYLARSRPEGREFSSITLAIGPAQFEAAKRELRKFRRKLHAISAGCKDPTAVYQFTMAAFPLTFRL